MRRSLPALLLALGAVCMAAPAAGQVDPAEYEKAIETIRCDCGCHPQSVKDCACGRATEMRREIHDEMSADPLTGKPEMSADELIARYVERQGEQILIAPAAAGFNLLAWLGPLGGLLVASAGVVLLLRHWHRKRPAAVAAPVAPLPQPDDPYLERLNKELEELE